MIKVGEMFGVSDNAVRKWCKNYEITVNKKWKPDNSSRTTKYHKLDCFYCKEEFELEEFRIRDKIKKGYEAPYCSVRCSGKSRNKSFTKKRQKFKSYLQIAKELGINLDKANP